MEPDGKIATMLEDKSAKLTEAMFLIVGLSRSKMIAHHEATLREDANGKPFPGPLKLIGFVKHRREFLPEMFHYHSKQRILSTMTRLVSVTPR